MKEKQQWLRNKYSPFNRLIWQWKHNHLKTYLLSKMVMFHCHVSFRGWYLTNSSVNHPNHLFLLVTRWWFQIFFIFTPTWGNDPIWRDYFSNGLVQPPTRLPLVAPCFFFGTPLGWTFGQPLRPVPNPWALHRWAVRQTTLLMCLGKNSLDHRIHGTDIFAYICLIFMVNI